MNAPSEGKDQRDDIVDYLTKGKLLENAIKAKLLQTQATRYAMIFKNLYQRGFLALLLKFLTQEQAKYIIRELHEGICGVHSGGQTMATCVLRAKYYWLTLRTNCPEYVKRCIQCQKHNNLIQKPANKLHTLASPWSFAIQGMDLLGPFLLVKGQCKYLLVTIDYFTKWMEIKPLTIISALNVQKFLWKNIITRFGILHTVITGNDLQFTNKKLNDFMKALGINHRVTSVEHPQTNGQVKVANKVILVELKMKLNLAKGKWSDKLLEVLQGIWCTPQSITNETPF